MDTISANNKPASSPLLSVIMPAYNAADTLGEQLNALKAQTFQGKWEILVVNNRSTDNTVDIVQEYQQYMPHLRLIQAPERPGRAYACNVGAQSALGDAFIFCDADDVVTPGWLGAFTEALERHDVVVGAVDVDTLNQCSPWRPSPAVNPEYLVLDFLPYAIGCNFGISRQAFEAIQGMSEEAIVCEDIDLSWRLQLFQGYTIQHIPTAIIHYRYRKTRRGMFKQFVSYGEAHACLYRRFALHGMPQSSVRKALKIYFRLTHQGMRMLLRRIDQQKQEKWLFKTAIRLGRLRGSLRYRVLYL